MAKSGNNLSRGRFSDHDAEIIDQITITLGIVLDNIMKDFKNPKQVMKEYSDINSSRAKVTRAFTALSLTNIDQEKGAYPAQIQKAIIEMSRGFYKKFLEDFLSNPPNLSKVLKEFEDAGIIFSIIGKKEIKKRSPKSVPRKPKDSMYEERRLEGPPVVKKLTATVQDYKTILSNPQALDLINTRLRKHGILKKAYDLISKNAFYAFKKGDVKMYDFLETFKELFPDLDPSVIPDSKVFREGIKAAERKTMERMRKELVQHLLNTPINSIFFIFSLAKLEAK